MLLLINKELLKDTWRLYRDRVFDRYNANVAKMNEGEKIALEDLRNAWRKAEPWIFPDYVEV